jgi:ubiquinone/menaquinone biosynthesis C-methylase UbiE
MNSVQISYNKWAETYDVMLNKTRDLEGHSLRTLLADIQFENALELGCGTGKNTVWLQNKAKKLIASDFSLEMLKNAREKILSESTEFMFMDMNQPWKLASNSFDLITCSLVLEHIENLDWVFQEAARVLKPNGLFYIGELHPFKQYQGSKARFETTNGTIVLDCYTHHITDFFAAAQKNNLKCLTIKEWFDDDDKNLVPRILAMIFVNG